MGDGQNSFGLTASQLTHNGYVPNSYFKRANLGLGGSTKLAIGVNLSGNFSYSKSSQLGGFYGENQVSGVSSLFARSLFLARNWDLNLPSEDLGGLPLQPNVSGWDNPRWAAEHNTINSHDERIVAALHADYNITKWARLDYTLGTNVATVDRKEITDVGSRAVEGIGQLVLDTYKKQEIESDFLITLTPGIGEDFSLKTTLGHSINQRTITDLLQTGKQFIAKGIYNLKNTAQQQFTDDYYERRRIIGAFADVTLGFKDYAFLQGTLRNDWTSTLPEDSRSYLYYSISGSLVFSDLLGLTNEKFNYGKLRAAWAKVGKDAEPYQLQDVYTLNPNFLGRPVVTSPTTANNANLKPEFTEELELGTQLSFFERRIDLDLSWYNRKSTNQIAAITIPSSSGFDFLVENFGSIRNRGIEIDLTLRPIRSKNFSWDIHTAFTKKQEHCS